MKLRHFPAPLILCCAALLLGACHTKAETGRETETAAASKDAETGTESGSLSSFEIDLANGVLTEEKAPAADDGASDGQEPTSDAKTQEMPSESVTEAPDYRSMITAVMYSMDHINVRSAPSTESEIIGHLNPEEEIGIIRKVDPKWTEAVFEGQLCYVASEYLTDDPDWRAKLRSRNGYSNGAGIGLDPSWRFADYSAIHSGQAVMYLADNNRNNIVVGVNAGHGTKGGSNVKTYCHPDKTPKVTGGSTAAGAVTATAVSTGMNFTDGASEHAVSLKMARILKDMLLEKGYDVLMIRDGEDVQLDNIARTVICNNAADCHIALHWDGDSLDYDKGCYYMSVPDKLKSMDPVSGIWQEHEELGDCLVSGLRDQGLSIFGDGRMDMDLTQTSFSTVPSVDIELGNQCSDHSDEALYERGRGLVRGIDLYFGNS